MAQRSACEYWLKLHLFVLGAFFLTIFIGGCPPAQNGDDNEDDDPPTGVASGLNVEITNVAIPADLRPVISFRSFDNNGNTIPLAEFTDIRFILAYLETPEPGSTAVFTSYTTSLDESKGVEPTIQAAYDGARLDGVTQTRDGFFVYKFETALPPNFDRSATHQLGGQFRRLYPVDQQIYIANVAEAFRPDGGAVSDARDIVSTAACNDCHTRLSEHGARREIQLCILCHSPQTVDAGSGNSLNLAEMIHKIHRSEDLPSVRAGDPYQIFRSRGRISDFSDIEFPQDIRNCTVCHSGASQADVYRTTPTLEGCASCHDRTWFGDIDSTPPGFTNHTGGRHENNKLCALCHGENATVAPVDVAHLLPTESVAAVGLNAEITNVLVSMEAKGAIARVTIEFNLFEDSGEPIDDLADLTRLSAMVGYPVTEYQTQVRERIFRAPDGQPEGTLENLGNGAWRYTFAAGFPGDSTDTFAVGLDGRREFEFRGESERQGIDSNAVVFFTLDQSEPVERRMVVDQAKCNLCHRELRFHGASRTDVNYCIICHNPNASDLEERIEEGIEGPPVTINFKDMVHAIHTGEDLENDFTIAGHDFMHVRFPGLRQECVICHADIDTTDLPLPNEALSTLVTGIDSQIVSEVLPETAACTSCHDGDLAAAHAAVNTFGRTESCAVCHGPDAEFAVSVVHALEP